MIQSVLCAVTVHFQAQIRPFVKFFLELEKNARKNVHTNIAHMHMNICVRSISQCSLF